jgi:two-component system, NtrC family, sensor kinase
MLQLENQREIDSAVLNISGRQRMLSQRIALLLTLLLLAPSQSRREAIRQELQSLVDTLHHSHLNLLQGNAALKLPSRHSEEIDAIYWQSPVNLNQKILHYISCVQGFLDRADEALDIDDPDLQHLIHVEANQVLQALEVAVQQYAQESEARQTSMIAQLINLCEQREQMIISAHAQAKTLNETLCELHQTQAKLIHTEKMKGLGQLVAGIAHEVNNPVSFIHGNLKHAIEYSQDLIALIQTYESEYPNPTLPLQLQYEDLDVPFLTHDFPELMLSMKSGTERLRDIVLSLRNFARLDEAELKCVDVHEGLESAILLIQHRLLSHSLDINHSPANRIQIQKQYGKLPRLHCYAGQLNQVFIAILNNAIDALELALELDPTAQPKISITTHCLLDESTTSIEICIRDNGVGIAEGIQTQIFNPFFTTKPVGQGTGLGLAICHQIIAQHQGEISCQSQLGQFTELVIRLPVEDVAID